MPKFKKYAEEAYKGAYSFFCPGCQTTHVVWTDKNDNIPTWDFNGDIESPTVSPSIKVVMPIKDKENICHSFIRNGQIEYLNDCTHELRGKTIDLPNID